MSSVISAAQFISRSFFTGRIFKPIGDDLLAGRIAEQRQAFDKAHLCLERIAARQRDRAEPAKDIAMPLLAHNVQIVKI